MTETDYVFIVETYLELFAVFFVPGYLLAALHVAVKLVLPYR